MKKDWTYKKLGEVAEIIMGQSPAGSSLNENNGIEFHQGKVAFGEKYLQHSGCFTNKPTKLTEGHSLLLCVRAPVGILNMTDRKICIGRGLCAITAKEITDTNYLYYVLKSKQSYFEKNATGSTFKAISSAIVKDTIIPIPPLSIQRSIVNELDLLHSVIEKKQEQLRALDNLAQSLFYQMFGDPITNPMGWEVKKLGEVGIFERGKGISKNDFVEDGAPCIHYGQLHTAFGASTTKHLSCISESLIDNPRIAHTGDVLLALTSEDVEGSCKSTAWLGDYDIIVGSDAAVYHHTQDGMYISFYTRTEAFYKQKEKYAHGFKVTHISTKDIETFTIPLPPLSLQQSFAAKVSAIEAQKQAITQSIKDVESLLAQRMDHYFG